MKTKTAHMLDGKKIAEALSLAAAKKIESLKMRGVNLTLATLQAGHSKDTELYAQYLSRVVGKVGIGFKPHVFDENVTEETLVRKIGELNHDPGVTGIMVFTPLPKSLDKIRVLDAIDLRKDAEGRGFLKGHFGVFSPTANAVLTLIDEAMRLSGGTLEGKEAVVVGHSDLVGKPTAVLLMDRLATVTVCHVKTQDTRRKVSSADIVVAAVGKPELIKGDWIKPGAVVIDVGENVVDGRIVGDVELEKARERAAFISPVPGGVGPLTNIMLIKNLVRLHELMEVRNGNH